LLIYNFKKIYIQNKNSAKGVGAENLRLRRGHDEPRAGLCQRAHSSHVQRAAAGPAGHPDVLRGP